MAELKKDRDRLLVVTRKIGERILIGDKVVVTVVKIGNGGVRIGVEAPPEMAIVREELAEQLRLAETTALDLTFRMLVLIYLRIFVAWGKS